MYNYGLIGNRESRGESPDFRLPTSDLAITPYIPYVTNSSPNPDFRLPTSDFRLPTSNFGLKSFHHFPFPSSANHDGELDTSWYRNILNISSAYQILPRAASQKQLPLLKESGQQLSFLGHVLRLPDNKPVREFVMYRFQLRGGGNPEDSEPCSPVVYLLSSGES